MPFSTVHIKLDGFSRDKSLSLKPRDVWIFFSCSASASAVVWVMAGGTMESREVHGMEGEEKCQFI